jgi:hypothetical protein
VLLEWLYCSPKGFQMLSTAVNCPKMSLGPVLHCMMYIHPTHPHSIGAGNTKTFTRTTSDSRVPPVLFVLTHACDISGVSSVHSFCVRRYQLDISCTQREALCALRQHTPPTAARYYRVVDQERSVHSFTPSLLHSLAPSLLHSFTPSLLHAFISPHIGSQFLITPH